MQILFIKIFKYFTFIHLSNELQYLLPINNQKEMYMTRKRNLTESQKKSIQQIFRKLVVQEGSNIKLANKLGVSPSAICHFLSGYNRPGEEVCMKLFKLYGIPLNVLRPDIYNV